MANYIALVLGKLKEIAGTVTSTGAPDAGKIPALDGTGKLDISLMPTGVGAEVVVAASKESIAIGAYVNLVLDGGVIKVQNADATNNAKPANGFVQDIITHPDPAVTVYLLGVRNSNHVGLTIGTKYFLSKAIPGGVVDAATVATYTTGNICQELGIATLTTELLTFNNINYIEIA